MKKRKDVAERIEAENERMAAALKTLVGLYVMNPGGNEFLSCVTARQACEMTMREREACEFWSAWDEARAILADRKRAKGGKR